MLSCAPASLARSIAWRTASAAVSDPSVPTTMRVNTPASSARSLNALILTPRPRGACAGRPRKPSPRISVGVVARRTIAIAIEASRQTTRTAIPAFQIQGTAAA